MCALHRKSSSFHLIFYRKKVANMFTDTDRSGLIVWVNDIKAANKHLDRYGSVHFISKRLHYAAMYVHASKLEETMKQLQKLPFVKKVERSYRNEIQTEYTNDKADKSRFYTL
jgi:uncharacterized protein YlbG (UPF0298 family)